MQSRIIYSFTTLLLLASLWACTTDQTGASQEEDNIQASSLPESSLLASLSDYEIDADTALANIERYELYIDSVINVLNRMPNKFPNLEGKLIYGVKVDRKELLDVLEARPEDSLYIMTGTKLSGETEFFFAFESKSLRQNKAVANTWHFYDFTQPCPTACPDFKQK